MRGYFAAKPSVACAAGRDVGAGRVRWARNWITAFRRDDDPLYIYQGGVPVAIFARAASQLIWNPDACRVTRTRHRFATPRVVDEGSAVE